MRVAFIHDWLGTYRGGEKVLEALLELFPEAPIYTLFYQKGMLPDTITRRQIRTPRVVGGWFDARKTLLPFLPALIESLDFSQFDLLISTSHCVAKGAISAPHAKHVCYLHSPMRYAWDQRFEYLQGLRNLPLGELLAESILSKLRTWDVQSCTRVDQFVANSSFVQARARRYYGRESAVIHPPIEQRFFATPLATTRQKYLLCFGAFVGYKRFDLAIEAARRLQRELVIAGAGPDESRLRALAGKNVRFVIQPTDEQALRLLADADALLFPGVEDFGMIPVEALALGTPVVALGRGGVLDSVEHGQNGILFDQATTESLEAAIKEIGSYGFNSEKIRASSQRFSRNQFLTAFRDQLKTIVGESV